MTDSILPPSEILELICGQARLEAKIDNFFSAQTAMKAEIDGLKADIGAVKSDVAENQKPAPGNSGVRFRSSAGVFWLIVGEKVKKIFGI